MRSPQVRPELPATITLGEQEFNTKMLYSEAAVQDRVEAMGREIARLYAKMGSIHIIGVMTGAMYFGPQLSNAISRADWRLAITYDQMPVSTYTGDRSSGGIIRSRGVPKEGVEGLHVLIADNLANTGLALGWLTKILHDQNPASMAVAPAFQMATTEEIVSYVGDDVTVFSGLPVEPEQTVIGYGSDYSGLQRALGGLYGIEPRVT